MNTQSPYDGNRPEDAPPAINVLLPDVSVPNRGWGGLVQDGQDVTREKAWDETSETIRRAMNSGGTHLVDALPSTGKTYGAVKAASETGEPVTICVPRGHKEMYGQIKAWGDEFDLDVAVAPAFPRHCDTANGEFGEDWKAEVLDQYHRGATPKQIHQYHDDIPCQNTQGMRCGYKVKWETLDPKEYDIIVGHYSHAHVDSLREGRHVFLDEWPETYKSELRREKLRHSVNTWLEEQDWLDIEDWNDLITRGSTLDLDHDEEEWARERLGQLHAKYGDLDPEGKHVLEDNEYYSGAPQMVYTWLAGDEAGNGWVRAELPDGAVGIYHWEKRTFEYVDAPNWRDTRSLCCLDGTPTPELWEDATQTKLTRHQCLTDPERVTYIKEGLGHKYVVTTPHLKPYNNESHVNVDSDLALLEHIDRQYSERVGVISTRTALNEYQKQTDFAYEQSGEIRSGPGDTCTWYGNVLGSNDFESTRVGAVIGSNHYGNEFVEKWGAIAGEDVEYNGERGSDASFGPYGDKLLSHMREHETLQSVMRFGRDGGGAVVFVHTDTLPDWVPVEARGGMVDTWSKGEEQVMQALSDGANGGTREIAHHECVTMSERHVRRILKRLAEREIVDREYAGNGYEWDSNGNLAKVNKHGEVEIVMPDLSATERVKTADISRNTIYTLAVRRSDCDAQIQPCRHTNPVVKAFRERQATTPPPD